MTDTWFEVAKTDDNEFVILRMDRNTLPKATVVGGPYSEKPEADEAAEQMRRTGTA